MRARGLCGEANPAARITERDVLTIRFMVGMGFTQQAMCRMFGLGDSQVSRIVLRQKWRHLP